MTAAPTRDVEAEADIRAIVDAFYGDITADPVLGPYFADVDGTAHRDRMVAFWSSVAFQTGAYRGRPFAPHARLEGLTRAHFAHWVSRFDRVVGVRFAGPVADLLRARADQIAGVFQVKLGLWTVAP
ncbi:group III truncated hemoglobin [Rubrivirga sp. IMCC43871]|uniref:group III truncated hemoglobin n=1 Tax=Rubrivirga sp. IMCC43871 TaxID=3391575 RepID=UPI00399024F5